MEQPKFKIIQIDGEQFVALTIKDYSELWSKIGNLQGEIIALKLNLGEQHSSQP